MTAVHIASVKVGPRALGAGVTLLQRKCVCGESSGLTGSCAECEKKKLVGQPLQTKLRINDPGDEYEQEADRVVEQVMRMAESQADSAALGGSTRSSLQRSEVSSAVGAAEAPPIVHEVLSSPGQPLDAATRAFFEPRFGHDFGRVRVHVDSDAAESARAVHAYAYTVGSDIVFGAGQFAPQTREGQQLMAHELSHVAQPKRDNLGQNTVHREAKMPESPTKTEPPIDCTKEITTDYDCFDLIAEMSRYGFNMRENDGLIRQYDSGEVPFDQDTYDTRMRYKIELQKKYNEKERVRAACCASREVPGEPPTHVPTPVPQPTEPKAPSDTR